MHRRLLAGECRAHRHDQRDDKRKEEEVEEQTLESAEHTPTPNLADHVARQRWSPAIRGLKGEDPVQPELTVMTRVACRPHEADFVSGGHPEKLAPLLPGVQVLLQLSVEVLVRTHVEDLDGVPLGVELVGQQELLRTDLELDDTHALQGAELGLAGEGVGQQAFDRVVDGQLG